MTRLIVDASVAVKWYLDESHSDAAVRIVDAEYQLRSIDLLLPEVASALINAYRRNEIGEDHVLRSLSGTRRLVALTSMNSLIGDAVALALQFQRSAYDALYVALAIQERCPLVTADRKLYDAISPTLPDTLLWVEDIP